MIIVPDGFFETERRVPNAEQPLPLSQKAYLQLRRKIITIDLPPGAILDEAILQADLGLGRTPIREALQRLAWEKLVTIIPRRGIFVADIAITDLQRLFEMRISLEALAGSQAAQRGSAEHWRRMQAALGRINTPSQAISNETWMYIDEYCHQLIYEAADNMFLQDTLTILYALCLRLWYYFINNIGDMHQLVAEHEHILAALKSRDTDLASQLLELHVSAFQAEIQRAMLDMPMPG